MTRTSETTDVLIIGAGIAGASLAYFLSERGVADVLVLEREPQAGYHATGRSAATLAELDPIPTLQSLKMMAAPFLRDPPDGFAENPLLEQRGVLSLFREPLWGAVCTAAPIFEEQGLALRLLTPAEASESLDGVLDRDEFDGAAFVAGDGFIDVHELLSSYMRHARQGGVEFRFATPVTRLITEGGTCRGAVTADGEIRANWVVNAAGAWVADIAAKSGAVPISFQPLRRSVVLFRAAADVELACWPLVGSEPHSLYFRPEGAGLLFCPMDEEPTPPCDASPDDVVIAAGLERLRTLAPRLVPTALGRRWAGLRTFSPDRVPVVGSDPRLPGFFWLAGQGGCGIETSPALGRIAADLLATGRTDGFDTRSLAPERFAGMTNTNK